MHEPLACPRHPPLQEQLDRGNLGQLAALKPTRPGQRGCRSVGRPRGAAAAAGLGPAAGEAEKAGGLGAGSRSEPAWEGEGEERPEFHGVSATQSSGELRWQATISAVLDHEVCLNHHAPLCWLAATQSTPLPSASSCGFVRQGMQLLHV